MPEPSTLSSVARGRCVRAERRTGELLKEAAKAGARTPGKGGDKKSSSTRRLDKLADYGISKNQSSDWQRLADIPGKRKNAPSSTTSTQKKIARERRAIARGQNTQTTRHHLRPILAMAATSRHPARRLLARRFLFSARLRDGRPVGARE